ncbi:hypothetical protein F4780DRAFT_457496 [Xylariomycetidae sp. FL0641]|nr:hypothetical protein F4780DRAFT_457496 [Xylariomycetidae sp. FL0641]
MDNLRKDYAVVQWWDPTQIYVSCPFCEGIHKHIFTTTASAYAGGFSCDAPCEKNSSREYRIKFSVEDDQGNATYFINKKRAIFMSGQVDPNAYVLDDAQRGLFFERRRAIFDSMSRWESSGESNVSYDKTDLELVVKHMTKGNCASVRQYLETTQEADLFLRGVQPYNCRLETPGLLETEYPGWEESVYEYLGLDEDRLWPVLSNGNTALILAAAQPHPDMVKLLLAQEATDANARTVEGRTALMEASLWGHLENVRELLAHGASNDYQCIRGWQLLTATDLAKPHPYNAMERRLRSPNAAATEKDQDRRRIVRLLTEASAPPEPEVYGVRFEPRPEESFVDTVTISHLVREPWKTVAILYRGNAFSAVSAVSGWGHIENNLRVGGGDWTRMVLKLCRQLDYKLASDPPRDGGEDGQYAACHAEMQLIAYFVVHHVFLQFDTGPYQDKGMWDDGRRYRVLQDPARGKKMTDLKAIAPASSLKGATIWVSKDPCDNCKAFAKHVNDRLGLRIELVFTRQDRYKSWEDSAGLCSQMRQLNVAG